MRAHRARRQLQQRRRIQRDVLHEAHDQRIVAQRQLHQIAQRDDVARQMLEPIAVQQQRLQVLEACNAGGQILDEVVAQNQTLQLAEIADGVGYIGEQVAAHRQDLEAEYDGMEITMRQNVNLACAEINGNQTIFCQKYSSYIRNRTHIGFISLAADK